MTRFNRWLPTAARRPAFAPQVVQLEDRVNPSRPLPFPVIYAGAETGAPPIVKAFDAETGLVNFERTAYEATFTGGVRVATADFTADGWPDLVVAPGVGGAPRVRLLDGKTGDPIPGPLGDFFAFEQAFTGGVEVAAADIDGDGVPDLIAAAGQGGGPRVRVFHGVTGAVLADFFAYDPAFAGGVSVAAADFTGDGKAELAVGAGAGGGPHVKVIDVASGRPIPGPLGNFFAFDPATRGGAFVGADWKAGDVTGDRRADLLVGAGLGLAPTVKVYSGRTGAKVQEFAAFEPAMTAGVRVAAAYVTDDAYADVVVATAKGVADRIRVFDARTSTQISGPTGEFAPFNGGRTGGVTLAASNDPPVGTNYPVPLAKTSPFTDGFHYPDSYNGAFVEQSVTVAGDRYIWQFIVTNASTDDATDGQDLYSSGLARFAVRMPFANGVEVSPSSEWAGSLDADEAYGGGGEVTWTGGPLWPQGDSVTLAFTTPARPVVDGGGDVFNAEREETSNANGALAVPGKPPEIDISIPYLIPVNANNDNAANKPESLSSWNPV